MATSQSITSSGGKASATNDLGAQLLDEAAAKTLQTNDPLLGTLSRPLGEREGAGHSDVGLWNLGGTYVSHDNLHGVAETQESLEGQDTSDGKASLSSSFDYLADPGRSPSQHRDPTGVLSPAQAIQGNLDLELNRVESPPETPLFSLDTPSLNRASQGDFASTETRETRTQSPEKAHRPTPEAAPQDQLPGSPEGSDPRSTPPVSAPVSVSAPSPGLGQDGYRETGIPSPQTATPPPETPQASVPHPGPPTELPPQAPTPPASDPTQGLSPQEQAQQALAEVGKKLDQAQSDLADLREATEEKVHTWETEKDEAHGKRVEAEETVARLTGEIANKANQAEAAKTGYENAEAERQAAEDQLALTEQKRKDLETQVENTASEVVQAREDHGSAVQQQAAVQQALSQALEEEATLTSQWSSAQEKAELSSERANLLATKMDDLVDTQGQETEVVTTLRTELATEQTKLDALRSAYDTALSEKQRGSGYYKNHQSDIDKVIQDYTTEKALVDQLKADLAQAETKLQTTEASIATLAPDLTSAQEEAEGDRGEASRLQSEKSQVEGQRHQLEQDQVEADTKVKETKEHWDNREHELQALKEDQEITLGQWELDRQAREDAEANSASMKAHWDNRNQELQSLKEESETAQGQAAVQQAKEAAYQGQIDGALAEVAEKEAEVQDLTREKEELTHANNGFGNGDQTAPGDSGTHNNAENSLEDGSGSDANNGFGNGDQTAPGGSGDTNNAENSLDSGLDAAVESSPPEGNWVEGTNTTNEGTNWVDQIDLPSSPDDWTPTDEDPTQGTGGEDPLVQVDLEAGR